MWLILQKLCAKPINYALLEKLGLDKYCILGGFPVA